MALTGITVGDYGYTIMLTVQQDGVAQDISSYTTLEYLVTKPDGTHDSWTVAFDDDGGDGVLVYNVANGDIDQAGYWQVRARVGKTGAELTSQPIEFLVDNA